MEGVLEVCARPYHPNFPVLYMDESSMQLIGEVHGPIPAAPDHPVLVDDEYVRNRMASIFIEVEPFGGKRKVKITERVDGGFVTISGCFDTTIQSEAMKLDSSTS